MSVKHIPASTITTCDCCGCEADYRSNAKKRTTLILQRCALDMYGQAAANGDWKADLCDACESEVSAAINAVITNHAAAGGES